MWSRAHEEILDTRGTTGRTAGYMADSEELPRRLRGPSREEDQRAGQTLKHLFARVRTLIDASQAIAIDEPDVGSDMAKDNVLTEPVRLGDVAGYSMSVAVDNLKALITLVDRPDGGLEVHQVAEYPLIRSAIEAAAQVVWILMPQVQQQRVERMLIVEYSEQLFDRRLVRRLGQIQPDDDGPRRGERNRMMGRHGKNLKENLDEYRAIAKRAGIAQSQYSTDRSHPGWQHIVNEAAQSALLAPDMGVTMWMVTSGLTHPSRSRGLMFSVVEELSPPVGDVLTTRLSASVQTLSNALTIALAYLREADRLIRVRRTAPLPDHERAT